MFKSKEALLKQAREQGYKPEILEKVYRLLDILQQILSVPYLKERLVLKGGTALNLFHFDHIPRLSVDIDLNYIGSLDREVMLKERVILTEAIDQILQQNRFERSRSPGNHAGGKMIWSYDSVLGQKGTLEIDLNFMHRQLLWPLVLCESKVIGHSNFKVPVLDIHELTAGKLTALFDRKISRDLFDAHQLMTRINFDIEKLRLSWVVYLAMSNIDLEFLLPESIQYDLTDLKNRLLPVLQQNEFPRSLPTLKLWAEKLCSELRESLLKLLPLHQHEKEFIQNIRQLGQINPGFITQDLELSKKISSHPALLWAAKNDRK